MVYEVDNLGLLQGYLALKTVIFCGHFAYSYTALVTCKDSTDYITINDVNL